VKHTVGHAPKIWEEVKANALVPAPVAAAAASTSRMSAELQQRLNMSAAQTADIQAAMQGLRAALVQAQLSPLPPVVPQLGLGVSPTSIPALSFGPRRLA